MDEKVFLCRCEEWHCYLETSRAGRERRILDMTSISTEWGHRREVGGEREIGREGQEDKENQE